MSARYAIKVAQMKDIADKLSVQITQLNNQKDRIIEQNEGNLALVCSEAAERLEVADHLREIIRLEAQAQKHAKQVERALEISLFSRYRPHHTLSERAEQFLAGKFVPDSEELHDEINQICRERGFAPIRLSDYRLPHRDELVAVFKACKTVAEIQQVVLHHQQAAIEHLKPVLANQSTKSHS